MHKTELLLDLMRASTSVLFDFNGTLSDDETELEAAYAAALLDMGLPAMSSEEYASLLGMSEPDIAHALMETRGFDVEESLELLSRVGEQYAEICRTNPRVSQQSVEMVRHLQARGLNLAIVTGTLRQLIEPILDDRGITDCFQSVLTIEDVKNGKPDPEGFLRAAELIGEQDTTRVLVFEDSPAGVAAAKSAGMKVVGIGPSAHGADLMFNSMGEVAGVIRPQSVR